jgi:hypothetical protein
MPLRNGLLSNSGYLPIGAHIDGCPIFSSLRTPSAMLSINLFFMARTIREISHIRSLLCGILTERASALPLLVFRSETIPLRYFWIISGFAMRNIHLVS